MTDNRDTEWPQCESDQVQMMLLGTYHMDNPGLDEVNVAADDVLAPKHQEELRMLTTQLASWQPERVAVERPYDRSEAVNTLYDEYRIGERGYNQEETIDPPNPERNEPPTAAEEPITDSVRTIEPHHLFRRTMANVNQRIGQLWETESPKQ